MRKFIGYVSDWIDEIDDSGHFERSERVSEGGNTCEIERIELIVHFA